MLTLLAFAAGVFLGYKLKEKIRKFLTDKGLNDNKGPRLKTESEDP